MSEQSMDIKKIEKLIVLLKKHDLGEIEVEEPQVGRVRIMAKKDAVPRSYARSSAPALVVDSTQPAKERLVTSPSSASSTPSASPEDILRSPLVGTYYESPTPGSDPFVRPGKRVRKGETLCIIEAMKIMNEIESDRDGVIKEILVRNGQPVEFDQNLFLFEG